RWPRRRTARGSSRRRRGRRRSGRPSPPYVPGSAISPLSSTFAEHACTATGALSRAPSARLALDQRVDDEAGDLRGLRAGAEAGVVAELARELVIDARPAEEEEQAPHPALPRQL